MDIHRICRSRLRDRAPAPDRRILESCAHETLAGVHVLDYANVAGKPPRHERDAAISQMPDTISPVGERIDANCLGVHVRLDRRHDDGPPKGTLPL